MVVLDGHTLNPGDLSWESLAKLGDLTVYERTGDAQIAGRATGARVLLTNKTPLSRDNLRLLSECRYVGVLATGYNIVDVGAAKEKGITVTNVPTYGTQSVAQMVFAHLLNLTQHVADHAAGVRDGDWSRAKDFCYWAHPLVELAGKTMGIVGLGRIGRATAGIACAMGMAVIACDPDVDPDAVPGCRAVSLDELFRESDVVTLHCPLTDSTAGVVSAERLATMKPTAFLVNTSRGALVDVEALARALDEGRLAGAGLDVLPTEPPEPGNPLMHTRNCFVTPHISWATAEARGRLMREAVENVRAFLEGEPRNVVNP